jgi:hypothetical protein
MTSKLPFVVLAVFAIFWAWLLAFSSPLFGGTDVFIFRDASCNCASHLGFVTSSAPTHPAYVPPVVFADYTPGTLLIFAPIARIFGCKPYTDTYWELLLLLVIACFVVAFVPDDEEHRGHRMLAALIAGMTLPAGLFESGADRPEPLAIAVFFVLLMLWKRAQKGWVRALIVGLSGSLFLVHPYVGIAAYLLFLLFVACNPAVTGRLKIVAGSIVFVLASVLIWLAILHHSDPSAIHRFIEHALGAKSGAGVVLKSGSEAKSHAGALHSYFSIFKRYADSSNRLRILALVVLFISFAILGAATARLRDPVRRRGAVATLLALFAILFLFPVALFSGQVNYFIASEALLFGTVAVGGYAFSDEMRKGKAVVFLLVICAIASMPNLTIQVLRSVETTASFAQALAQEGRVKQAFQSRGMNNPRLLVDAAHYFVYKPDFPYIYNSGYFAADDTLDGFDGLARCYTSSLAFSRSELAWEKPFREDDWELIDGDSTPVTIHLFGRKLMRRNWTWSCDVYAHKKRQVSASYSH